MVRASAEKKTNLLPSEEKTELIPYNKNPHFFKIYFPDHSSQKLKIPPGFVKLFNGVVPNKTILRSHDGRVWNVEMEQVGDSLFFQNGWQGFVKDQSLQLGEFLVFRYNGNLVFDVKIFGKNGCEKVEALACKNYDQATSHIEEEEEPEAQRIIFPELSPKYSRRATYGSSRSGRVEETILKAAGMARPKNPHFLASFKPSRPYEMFIPLGLIKNQSLKIKPEMTIRDPSGKSWCVKMSTWKDGRVHFATGWPVLCRKNNLGIDDTCIFEFIKGRDRKHGTIQMHIVRAGAGTSMPDTKMRQEA